MNVTDDRQTDDRPHHEKWIGICEIACTRGILHKKINTNTSSESETHFTQTFKHENEELQKTHLT